MVREPPVDGNAAGRSAGDAWRSELIFLGASGTATTLQADGRDVVVIRTPDNPTYWWGNALHFDGPPGDDDIERWPRLFHDHIAADQPRSRHRTFSWDGARRGAVEPFIALGYEYFETLVLATDRGSRPIAVPHVDPAARIAPLAGHDWDALLDLMLDTRDADQQSLADYRDFATRRIDGWRALGGRGQGCWFGIRDSDDPRGPLLSALGIFVEAAAGPDGRRIGRFQHVVTRVEARRRGLAGMLVAEAARHAFERLRADSLLILADENDAARRVYQAAGFEIAGWKRGLESRPALA